MCVPTLRAPLHAAHTGANNECAIVVSFPRVFHLWLLLDCFLFIFKLRRNKEKVFIEIHLIWGRRKPFITGGRCGENEPGQVSVAAPGMKVKRTHQLLEVQA